MSTPVDLILQDEQLLQIMKQLHSDDDTDKKLCMLTRQATERLRAMGFVKKLRLPPKAVGIHPSNRNEYGFVADEVLDLGDGVCGIGIDESYTSQATAFGEGPKKLCDAHTRSICNANPNLATFFVGEVLGGAVACTQTNQFLCCVIDQVECDKPKLSTNGRIDRAKLESQDPGLANLLKDGLLWDWFSPEVEQAYPEFPGFVQRAKNASGQLQREDNQFQVILDIQRRVSSCLKSGQKLDFDKIQAAVLQGRRKYKDDLPAFVTFVSKYGGGVGGQFIEDLVEWSKVFFEAGRILPVSLFVWISDLKVVDQQELLPYLMVAIVKTEASCKKTVQRMCKCFNQGDISSILSKNKAICKQGNEHLKLARDHCRSNGVQPYDAVRLLGRLDTRTGRFIFDKPMVEKYESLQEIFAKFEAELADVVGKQVVALNAPQPATEQPKPDAHHFVINYEQAGCADPATALQTVLSNGYTKGCTVKASDGMYFKVLDITDAGDMIMREINQAGCMGKEQLVKYTDVPSYRCDNNITFELYEYPARSPIFSEAFEIVEIRSMISMALTKVAAMHGHQDVIVRMKPTRRLFAVDKVKKDELHIVPYSTKILAYDDISKMPSENALQILLKDYDCGKTVFAVLQEFNEKFVVPAWALLGGKNCSEPGFANMKLVYTFVGVHRPEVVGLGKKKAKDKDTDYAIQVGIPVFVNTKQIQKHEELKYHHAASYSKEKGKRVLELAPVPKEKKEKTAA
jgi:hypothetical protein